MKNKWDATITSCNVINGLYTIQAEMGANASLTANNDIAVSQMRKMTCCNKRHQCCFDDKHIKR